MKIFVIHKGKDSELINRIIQQKNREIYGLNFLVLQSKSKFWKRKAKKIISKSDRVLYFSSDEYNGNIDWEITVVKKMGIPLFIIPLKDEFAAQPFLLEDDDGYGKKPKAPIVKMADIDSVLSEDNVKLRDKLFTSEVKDSHLLFEQYKLLLETSENLVERRQKLTTTYLSVCSILIPIITAMLTMSNPLINLASIIISLLSVILCICWKNAIFSYGRSNQAKFAIMELIEKELPANIFGSEWIALKKIGKQYMSFTERETSTPKIFIVLDIVFILGAIAVFVLKQAKIF